MSHEEILLAIVGIAIVTYIPRITPALLFSGRELPPVIERWLGFVPTAVFGALIFSDVFISGDGSLNFAWRNVNLLTSLVVLPVAAKTKSLAWSIVVGLSTYYALSQVL